MSSTKQAVATNPIMDVLQAMGINAQEDVFGLRVAAAIVFFTVIFLLFFRKPKGSRRCGCCLVGPSGGGKTSMFYKLVIGKDARRTFISMTPQSGTVSNPGGVGPKTVELTDYPGHQRLRANMKTTVDSCEAAIFVLDATSIKDTETSLTEVAARLLDVLSCVAVQEGATRLMIACNKRDEITSYRAKDIKTMLEAELSKISATREGALGAIGGSAGFNVNAGGGAGGSDSDRKFTFERCVGQQVVFADVAVFPGERKFNLEPVTSFLFGA